MKCAVFLITLVSFTTMLNAQNLVPNPGFEEFDKCPFLGGDIYGRHQPQGPKQTVLHWINPCSSSPDYFNACADSSLVGVPNNFLGYHTAHNGNAYTGILAFYYSEKSNFVYPEYLQCRLSTPLTAGKNYMVSCYVKLFVDKDDHPSSKSGEYATDHLEVNFSDTQLYAEERPLMATAMPIRNSSGTYVTDTISWTKLSGIYTAKGGEQWLTLGMFNSAFPRAQLVHTNSTPVLHTHNSYYMIDDVSVELIDTVEPGKNCIVIPSAFTPNADGLNDVFRPLLSCHVEKFTMRIFNRWGQQVYYSHDPGLGWNGLHGASLADVGTYFYYLEYIVAATGQRKSMKGDLTLIR